MKALAELLNAKPGEIPAPSLVAGFHPAETTDVFGSDRLRRAATPNVS